MLLEIAALLSVLEHVRNFLETGLFIAEVTVTTSPNVSSLESFLHKIAIELTF